MALSRSGDVLSNIALKLTLRTRGNFTHVARSQRSVVVPGFVLPVKGLLKDSLAQALCLVTIIKIEEL